MSKTQPPYIINSITELHRLLQLPAPAHPLVSVIRLDDVNCYLEEAKRNIVYNFYSICTKKGFQGRLKYGQTYYDFDEGTMTFFSPGQVTAAEVTEGMKLSGWWLLVHPDFIQRYPIGQRIREYGYFSYAANEALHLSEGEDVMLTGLVQSIAQECRSGIDQYTQDIVVTQVELLLNYCNRFYNRQFITRNAGGSDLLIRVERLLDAYFADE